MHAMQRASTPQATPRALPPVTRRRLLRCAAASPDAAIAAPVHTTRTCEVVRSGGDLTAVDGLGDDVPLGTRLVFDGGASGLLLSRVNSYGIVLLWPPSQAALPAAGAQARVSRAVAVVPHPDALLGQPPLQSLEQLVSFVEAPAVTLEGGAWPQPPRPVMAAAPGVPDRTPITTSLHSGVTAVDLLAPVGRGQCMLVVGEQGAGKTALVSDCVAAQAATGVKCVVAALGGDAAPLQAVQPHSVVLSRAPGPAPSPGIAFLGLCASFALAEAWRDEGAHALLALDDCSPAASFWAACTELVPAPVASPGSSDEQLVEFDGMLVSASAAERRRFFSTFLQRCARLNGERGGGSLTLLALLESPPGAYRFGSGELAAAQAQAAQQRSVAAYQTLSPELQARLREALAAKAAAASAAAASAASLAPASAVSRPVIEEFMSVSDGQIFLQRAAGEDGLFGGSWALSARDSVSRIGLEAAASALRTAGCGAARLELAQLDDADAFATGGGGAAQAAAERLRSALVQRAGSPARLSSQVLLLLALRRGACSHLDPDAVQPALARMEAAVRAEPAMQALLQEIDRTGELTADAQAALLGALRL